MTAVPQITLNDGQTIPQLGFGVFQIEPEDTAEAVTHAPSRSATGTSTPPRCTATRREVGEAVREVRPRPRRGLRHQQAQQRLPRARRRARRRSTQTLDDARLRLRRPVPHPLAAADALRRRLRLDLEGAGGVLPRRAGPLDRRLQLPGRTTCDRLHAETDVTPGGQPDRGAPVPDPGRGARLLRRARDRDRGVVAHRAGRGARRPGDRRDRRAASARRPAQVVLRWHIQRGDIVFPKSVTPDADQGELRHLRLRAGRRRRGRRSAR